MGGTGCSTPSACPSLACRRGKATIAPVRPAPRFDRTLDFAKGADKFIRRANGNDGSGIPKARSAHGCPESRQAGGHSAHRGRTAARRPADCRGFRNLQEGESRERANSVPKPRQNAELGTRNPEKQSIAHFPPSPLPSFSGQTRVSSPVSLLSNGAREPDSGCSWKARRERARNSSRAWRTASARTRRARSSP